MMKKQIFALLMCIVMCVSAAAYASAEDMDAKPVTGLSVIGEPYYDNEDGDYLGYVFGNILDENGNKLLENDWILLDCSDDYEDRADLVIVLRDMGDHNLYGFFDKQSRCFCEPRFESISFFTDNEAKLVAVCEDEQWGFCDRTSGETVIPCQYDGIYEDFRNGYAIVVKAFYDDDMEWYDVYEEYLLIDERGESVAFPDGISPFSTPNEAGYLVILSLEDNLFGIGDTQGRIIIQPLYENEPVLQLAYAE